MEQDTRDTEMERGGGEGGGDGSDSGLGSDTPASHTQCPVIPRHLADDSDDPDDNTFLSELVCAAATHAEPSRSSLKRTRCEEDSELPPAKRERKHVRFDAVTVFYFPRAQGFTCVPSQGGSTLGMERRHSHSITFTLHEHALEQRRARYERPAPSELAAVRCASDTDTDSDSDVSSSESELEQDGAYFLQPVGARARRALLRASGVRNIDPSEKDACRDIRASRELCGCACRDACRPDSCTCSRAGITCQVDRLRFPCPCVRGACANPAGRVEFDPLRVQTHFVRTLVRLGLDGDTTAPHGRTAPPSHVSHYQYADAHVKQFHSYSATSFEEFAHPTHMSMFNHYGHMYVPEYYRHQPTDIHYTNVEQDATPPCLIVERDVGASTGPDDPAPPTEPTDLVQPSDNFGEIIKKAMADTVIG